MSSNNIIIRSAWWFDSLFIEESEICIIMYISSLIAYAVWCVWGPFRPYGCTSCGPSSDIAPRVVQPIFPMMNRVQSLQQIMKSSKQDSGSTMQQSICYDNKRFWTISISWSYVVQVLRGVLSPRELEMPTRTFLNWYKTADYTAYSFNTRPVTNKNPCQKAFLFYMNRTRYDPVRKQIIGTYYRFKSRPPYCTWKMESPEKINSIIISKRPNPLRWQMVRMFWNLHYYNEISPTSLVYFHYTY